MCLGVSFASWEPPCSIYTYISTVQLSFIWQSTTPQCFCPDSLAKTQEKKKKKKSSGRSRWLPYIVIRISCPYSRMMWEEMQLPPTATDDLRKHQELNKKSVRRMWSSFWRTDWDDICQYSVHKLGLTCGIKVDVGRGQNRANVKFIYSCKS